MTVTDRALSSNKPVPDQRKGDGSPAADQGGATSTRKKRIVGAALLCVLLLAGAGAFFMLTGATEDPASGGAEVEAEPGAVVPLEPITINLAEGRYLQVGIALQGKFVEGGEEEEIDGSRALDILIARLSGMAMAELSSPEQGQAVKAELVAEIREAYPTDAKSVTSTMDDLTFLLTRRLHPRSV